MNHCNADLGSYKRIQFPSTDDFASLPSNWPPDTGEGRGGYPSVRRTFISRLLCDHSTFRKPKGELVVW